MKQENEMSERKVILIIEDQSDIPISVAPPRPVTT